MNKNGSKHHVCKHSSNAIIWLLIAMLHSLVNNVYEMAHLQKYFYLGGAPCPREGKWYPLCESKKRWKTNKSKQAI